MAFSHLGPVEGQQIVVGEDLDAVVVPKEWLAFSIYAGRAAAAAAQTTQDISAVSRFLASWSGSQSGRGWRGRHAENHRTATAAVEKPGRAELGVMGDDREAACLW